MTLHGALRRLSSEEQGFTMIIALGVLFVTGVLMALAFQVTNDDIRNSQITVDQKKAYYAALAGVQEYEYQLQFNPNYWQTCPEPKGEVAGEPGEKNKASFEVATLPAKTNAESPKKCNAASPFSSIIESSGTLANTFRVKATGKSGKESRSVVANFQVAGFLDYVYFTQFEDQDPTTYKNGNAECGAYRSEREAKGISCNQIYFGEEDDVKGPMHTNDTSVVCNGVEFGRPKHEPPDSIEINRGTVAGGCGSGSVVFNTTSGTYSKGPDLEAPPSDSSLKFYVEKANEFEGRTKLKLEGSVNKIKVVKASGAEETIEWPKNGLIFVANTGSGCGYTNFEQEATDTTATYESEKNCGSVYVEGTYSKSLTIAGATDVIISGNITETGVSNASPANPATGTATLGLIATRFVRTYHPCSGNPAGFTTPTTPFVYAAILSTSHSFLVDNDQCGSSLGTLTVYGAIGQKFRGIVGTFGGGSNTGYIKNYVYDERLATDEPPYFLAPLKAGWRIVRETAPTAG
jgi:hypothetical protein